MPNCPPRTDAQRTRWENIVGKALKNWTTALMKFGMTRKEARAILLSDIKERTEFVQYKFEEMTPSLQRKEGQ